MIQLREFFRRRIPERRIHKRVADAVTFMLKRHDAGDGERQRLFVETVRSDCPDAEIQRLEVELAASRKTIREVALGFIALTRDEHGEDCRECAGTGESEKDHAALEYIRKTDPEAYATYIEGHKRDVVWCRRCMGTGWVRTGSQADGCDGCPDGTVPENDDAPSSADARVRRGL